MTGFLNASCEKAMFGWPCDAEIEKLRDDFAKATELAKQKEIVVAIQKRFVEYPTHIPLGQWYNSGAHRDTVDGIIAAPAPVLWNISVK
jgi:peptide/nickel transport system substrate-binding protein